MQLFNLRSGRKTMISKTTLTCLLSVFFLTIPLLSSGQVLEALPDHGSGRMIKTESTAKSFSEDTSDSWDNAAHLGATLSGASGLISIPTPDFQSRKMGFSYRKGYVKSSMISNNQKIHLEKDEFFASLRANIKPNLELSASRLKYIRASNPTIKGLNFENEHYGVGLKYSTHLSNHNMCVGFNFTPMTAEELNLADIEQIENLRNVYVTMSERISDNLDGYLGLSTAFTKKQTIDFGGGFVQKLDRKEMLIASVGLEYKLGKSAALFGEAKFGNYRDIFKQDSVRHRIHGGFRAGLDNFQLEVMALNLTETNPTMVFGGSLGF